MSRTPTPPQAATHKALTAHPKVLHTRIAWEGRVMLLGVGYQPDPKTGVSTTRMYRIAPDGAAQGV